MINFDISKICCDVVCGRLYYKIFFNSTLLVTISCHGYFKKYSHIQAQKNKVQGKIVPTSQKKHKDGTRLGCN